MIEFELVKSIHEILIERFGGIHGLRDKKGLESAIKRPFMTFDQKDLYPTPILKAAALIENLISNHPIPDGNKRIGYVMIRFILLENKIDIKASQSDKYEFVMNIAKGQLSFDQITVWISDRAVNI